MAGDRGGVKAQTGRLGWTPPRDGPIQGGLRLETDLADGAMTSDGTVEAAASRGLTYPCGTPPSGSEARAVAPGVLWLRLAMPIALDHINVWALEDGDGWTLVDTGLNTPPTRDAWDGLLAGPLGGRPVKRVICTHMHPDHLGLAGWLCRRFDAPLLMTRLEYVTARMLVADMGQPAPAEGEVFYRAAGWSDAQIAAWRTGFGQFGKAVSALPAGYERLTDGQTLTIGDGRWTVLVGEGHSPEHACLLREADGVLIGGDQILPKISSNVSIWPTEPNADPLGDWLRSLAAIRERVPEDALVLPSHGEPFHGAHARLDALIRGHRKALSRLERTLAEPRRAVDVFSALFARPVGDGLLGMATGEALAHLNHLEREGRASRSRDADGVDRWTATTEEPAE